MAMTKEELLEAIKELPVIELAGLVKDLEEEFGVSAAAAAPVAVAAVPGAAVGGDAGAGDRLYAHHHPWQGLAGRQRWGTGPRQE